MIPLETEQYTLRPIRAFDADRIREAVVSNQARLHLDFPALSAAFADEADALYHARALAESTKDEQSGLDVFVAIDRDNERVLGLGMRRVLNGRQLGLLGALSLFASNPEDLPITSATLIAGWEVEDAPRGLAQDAGSLLVNYGHPFVLPTGAKSRTHTTLALIRPENTPAIQLANALDMKELVKQPKSRQNETSPDDEPIPVEIGRHRARFAGVKDGVQTRRRVYYRNNDAVPLPWGFRQLG